MKLNFSCILIITFIAALTLNSHLCSNIENKSNENDQNYDQILESDEKLEKIDEIDAVEDDVADGEEFIESSEIGEVDIDKKNNLNYQEINDKLRKRNLNLYRKLSVNDMMININGDDETKVNDNLIIKAYYKDDIQFDCELPEEFAINDFDWSVNGYLTGQNESSYNIILDKKIDSEKAFLNVSCLFRVANQSDYFHINFPIVHLDNYYFKHDISNGEYLKYKYQKQIVILTNSIFFLLIIGILVVLAGIVYKIRLNKKKLRMDEENKAFSEPFIEP